MGYNSLGIKTPVNSPHQLILMTALSFQELKDRPCCPVLMDSYRDKLLNVYVSLSSGI